MPFKFNPITGTLDLVNAPTPPTPITPSVFDIVTHFRNSSGTRIQTYERTSGTHIDSAPLVVVDNDGNVVAKGS